MAKNFYITTTLPYVNSDPHLGFALEIAQADVIARYKRMGGNEVIFNFGTDEHGLKIYRKALELGKDPQEYCDEYAAKFDALKTSLNLSYTNFIRTTDKDHMEAAQQFWNVCLKNGDIYKKNYMIRYCVGCELEKTDSELVNGKCEFHPNMELETYEEINYFFRFSKYQKFLLDFYEKNPDFVKPEGKFNEIKEFVKSGLEDFSVSRLKKKMPWGIDVPDDPEHTMFVWFDALVNYISTLGWPKNEKNFRKFWPGVQVAGKDNLRQQTAIWQAMLMSAGLPNSKQVFIHGFMTVDGQKISKSAGNAISPNEITDKYGTDALRYYLLAKIHPWEDSDFTWQKFNETYNAYLANGIGNVVARVAKLAETSGVEFGLNELWNPVTNYDIYSKEEHEAINDYWFNVLHNIFVVNMHIIDGHVNQMTPWTIKDKNKLHEILLFEINEIRKLAYKLQPFLPET